MFGPIAEYQVVRDLPDPSINASSTVGKAVRKPRLAIARSRRRRAVASSDFDLAHIETLTPQTDWLDLNLLGRKMAIVSVVHDVVPHDAPSPGVLMRRLLNATYANAGHLVVYHDRLKEELVAEFGVDRSRIHVLPIPLDSNSPTIAERPTKQRERPTVLLFGSLRRNKGIPVLLDVLERNDQALTSAQFVIAGSGDAALEEEIVRRSQSIPNLEIEIGFATPDRKEELLRAADVLVLPYTSFHSQSAVLADAYAHRVPLIVTDVGALGDTVRADDTGIVVTPGSVDELGAGLVTLLSEEPGSRREQLERAARLHDYGTVGPLLREVYDCAVSERRST
jgi:glycosyltransferase involved in cell wall biosynthesis